ncbi:MAG: hypothetical protein QOG69_2712 [Actinomycetota bacterium]|nr:hypothetical protein [Actinomycetota bacterium]
MLVAAGLAVIAGAIIVGLGSGTRSGDLDPRSFDPSGSHAISVLLAHRNVDVVTETDARVAVGRATSGTTLVVVHPDLLGSDDLHAIAASRADLVVVGARLEELQGLGFPVSEGFNGGQLLRDPACSLAAARVAGNAELGGDGYTVPDGQGCYPENDSFGLVTFTASGRRVTLLSDGTPLTNAAIGHSGNAALALGLLDSHPDVGWLVPPPVAPASGRAGSVSVTDLLPDRLKAAVVQLAIAVIVIALWRGRRLGRLVREDVPVVVRQSETVRGRSRLYRRSRSLDRASEALRQGTRHRLGVRLGLGPRAERAALVDAAATQAQSSAVEIDALLYGSTPTDEPALVALAQGLTALEQEVLRT